MLDKGIFIISVDTELAWGTFDHAGHKKYKEAYEKYRIIIMDILKIFEKYNIPATWAIVGHLFLDSCQREDGILHPDIIRPRHKWFSGDWFSYDPGTDLSRDRIWYGRDIVKMIKEAHPKQEIASHSFCHPVFSDKGCSRETAESDIAKCVQLALKEDIELKTFTFPRNLPGHLEILSKYGFRVFRGQGDRYCSLKLPGIIEKIYFLLDDMMTTTPPVVLPKTSSKHGLIEVPASMLFRFAYGKSRFIPEGVRFKKAKKGIDAAIKRKRVFHLWFHPISFAWKTNLMLAELDLILQYASKKKKEELLEVVRLNEAGEMFFGKELKEDRFNPQAISLHNQRSAIFKKDYADELASYCSSAFKFGRKKIESSLLRFLEGSNGRTRVLDVGCGTGYYLNLISRKGFECLGIDHSENMLRQLKNIYPALNVRLGDARRLSFKDDSFDAVISIETLRYFSHQEHLLREIYRVTKPGGRIFITAAPLFSLNTYGVFNSLCYLLRLKSLVSCYQSFETAGSLQKRLEEAGFKKIKIESYFFGPYFILDKINQRLSSYLMRKFEKMDARLEKYRLLDNFSNHLIAVAEKPGP